MLSTESFDAYRLPVAEELVSLLAATPVSPEFRDFVRAFALETRPISIECLAVQRDTPAEWLVEIAELDCFEIRDSLLCNPQLPASVLDRLSREADPRVQAAVARHRNTASETLAYLAHAGGSDDVVRQILRNPNATSQTVHGLLVRCLQDDLIEAVLVELPDTADPFAEGEQGHNRKHGVLIVPVT